MPPQLSDNDVSSIRTAILAGRTIEAIKLYRAATGAGLKDGKEFVEALAAALLRGASGEIAMPATSIDLEPMKAAIFAERKIEAIKLYRAVTGRGLKESKDFVEALESELRRTQETLELALAGRAIPRIVVPELNEIHFGRYDGGPLDDYRAWAWSEPPDVRAPGNGESRADGAARYARGLRTGVR